MLECPIHCSMKLVINENQNYFSLVSPRRCLLDALAFMLPIFLVLFKDYSYPAFNNFIL